MKRVDLVLVGFLVAAVLLKILQTSGGNFLFNMDSARDYVDVREMVELGKLRLIGPASGIEGFYTGPGWYYFLVPAYVLFQGDPWGGVLLMIACFGVGGFFIILLSQGWKFWARASTLVVWTFSNYISLSTVYPYNPSPVVLLYPLFVYLLLKYLNTGKLLYALFVWGFAGLNFNFEMGSAVFMPLIVVVCMFVVFGFKFVRMREFWLGLLVFGVFLAPQLLFDVRHSFTMSQAILRHIGEQSSATSIGLSERASRVVETYYFVVISIWYNNVWIMWGVLAMFGLVVWLSFKGLAIQKNRLILVVLVSLVVPFLGHLIMPVNVMRWHLGIAAAAGVLAMGLVLKYFLGKSRILGYTLVIVLLAVTFLDVIKESRYDFWNKASDDPSLYSSEIAAVDYVFREADGKNFKVYTYIPSVYDYPYQYLLWLRGIRKYGYVPEDYAYLADKPQYISAKEAFSSPLSTKGDSGLVFLIMEPERYFPERRAAWLGDFDRLEFIKEKQVGPVQIQTRRPIGDK